MEMVGSASSELASITLQASNESVVIPPDVQVASPGDGLPHKQAVQQASSLHHAAILPQVIVRLHQEWVGQAVAADECDLQHDWQIEA